MPNTSDAQILSILEWLEEPKNYASINGESTETKNKQLDIERERLAHEKQKTVQEFEEKEKSRNTEKYIAEMKAREDAKSKVILTLIGQGKSPNQVAEGLKIFGYN